MKALNRSIALALSIIMLLSVSIAVHAAEYIPQHTEEAETLYELGLFKGMGSNADGTPIFALEQKATRIQGLVMLIRLLGKEADALAYTGACPFTDVPAWAERYAAYAYGNGITNGTSVNTFSSDAPLLGKAYVTFVLRALGYNDTAGDFSYNEALVLGEELGLIGAGECTGDIYRDDCAIISYRAVKTKMKGADTTLMGKLIADGVLTDEMVKSSGVLEETIAVKLRDGFLYANDIAALIPDAYYVFAGGYGSNWSYSSIDWNTDEVRMTILLNAFRDYVTGKSSTLPEPAITPKMNRNFSVTKYHATGFVKVINKECQLIAYAVFPPRYSDDTIFLTTCQVGGKDVLDQIRSSKKNIPQYSVTDLRCKEYVTTIHSDGTADISEYIYFNESKLPNNLMQEAVYYSQGAKPSASTYVDSLLDYQKYAVEDGTYDSNFHKFAEKRSSLHLGRVSGEYYFYLYNANKELIAVVKDTNNSNVIETIEEETANPSTSYTSTPRSDEQVKETIEQFVAGYKNSAAYNPNTYAGIHADEQLDTIKNNPDSNKTLSSCIEYYRDGSLTDQSFIHLLERWILAGGCKQ